MYIINNINKYVYEIKNYLIILNNNYFENR